MLMAIDPATGQGKVLLECNSSTAEREALLAKCEPLAPARLEDLGLWAEIRRAAAPTQDPTQVPERPALSIHCPQELGLWRGTRRLTRWAFAPCCDSAAREEAPPLAAMTAYVLPGRPFLLTRLRHEGKCFDGANQEDVVFLADAFGSKGAPLLQSHVPRFVTTWALLDLPFVDLPRLYNDHGFSLYQQGHFWAEPTRRSRSCTFSG